MGLLTVICFIHHEPEPEEESESKSSSLFTGSHLQGQEGLQVVGFLSLDFSTNVSTYLPPWYERFIIFITFSNSS